MVLKAALEQHLALAEYPDAAVAEAVPAHLGASVSSGRFSRHASKTRCLSAFLTDPRQSPPSHAASSFTTAQPASGGSSQQADGEQPQQQAKEPTDYGGELQIMEDYRSPSVTFSDLTDNYNFTCWKDGPVKRQLTPLEPAPPKSSLLSGLKVPKMPWEAEARHPQLEFAFPHHKVHVHLEDRAPEYPSGRVLWDADYDMGGTEVLKGRAKALGGDQPVFHPFCPPVKGPAHWYELTVTRAAPKGTKLNPHHSVEDFLGSQVVTTYRPDQDPEMRLFGDQPKQEGGGGCTVM